jgi:ribosome-associated translation inhibitor RaiA
MKIQINVGDAERGAALSEFAEAEIQKMLGRFADRVTRVEVHLRDVNGPREGVDQRCSIEIRVAGLDPFAVDADAAEMGVAIREAAGKAQRALDRRIGKREAHR